MAAQSARRNICRNLHLTFHAAQQSLFLKFMKGFPYSHYDYLREHVETFFDALKVDGNSGIIGAHGDKCYSYRDKFEEAGLTFGQGVAIYFLSYLRPYSKECRETKNGWVDAGDWVVKNKDRFLEFLPADPKGEKQRKERLKPIKNHK